MVGSSWQGIFAINFFIIHYFFIKILFKVIQLVLVDNFCILIFYGCIPLEKQKNDFRITGLLVKSKVQYIFICDFQYC